MLNDGSFPKSLSESLLQDVGKGKVDLALGVVPTEMVQLCGYLHGLQHLIEIDPMPQKVPLDGSFSIRMEARKDQEAMLFIAPPDGMVEKSPLLLSASRGVPRMHIPGEYRYEVIVQSPKGPQVAALFSVLQIPISKRFLAFWIKQ